MSYYILDAAGQPAAVDDLKTWGDWYSKNPSARVVEKTTVGDAEVSTVFLAIDHRHVGDGPPILFETMIFGGDYDQHQWRYCTREQAIAGHDQAVAALRGGREPNVGGAR